MKGRISASILNLFFVALAGGVSFWFLWDFIENQSYIALLKSCVPLIAGVLIFRSWEPKLENRNPFSFGLTFFHIVLPILFEPVSSPVIPVWLGLIGLVLSVCFLGFSYLDLDRSFGLLPALRVLKQEGVYGMVRHPIYLAYLIAGLFVVLLASSWWNLLVLICLCVATHLRIRLEEEILSAAEVDYARYCQRVPYRLIPRIY